MRPDAFSLPGCGFRVCLGTLSCGLLPSALMGTDFMESGGSMDQASLREQLSEPGILVTSTQSQ